MFYSPFTISLLMIVAANFSRFCLLRYPKLTSKDLKRIHPRFDRINWKYYGWQAVIVLPIILILAIVYASNKPFWADKEVLLFNPIFAAFAICDSLFAIRTGVFSTPSRYHIERFVYDRDKKLQWVAYVQIILAVIVTVIDLALLF